MYHFMYPQTVFIEIREEENFLDGKADLYVLGKNVNNTLYQDCVIEKRLMLITLRLLRRHFV